MGSSESPPPSGSEDAPLTDSDRRLCDEAAIAQKSSHAPFSGYRVGAALLLADGTVVRGCNVENSVLPESVCAEKVALVKAVSEGRTDFVAIAVRTDSDPPATPCGSCRQMLFYWKVGRVILTNGRHTSVTSTAALLPEGFTLR